VRVFLFRFFLSAFSAVKLRRPFFSAFSSSLRDLGVESSPPAVIGRAPPSALQWPPVDGGEGFHHEGTKDTKRKG